MSATIEKKHVPGDVNHQMLGYAGYEFCPTCGSSLRGKKTALESEMLEALESFMAEERAMCSPESWHKIKAAIRKARGEA